MQMMLSVAATLYRHACFCSNLHAHDQGVRKVSLSHEKTKLKRLCILQVKFYTREGNWDLVGNNFPVFFIRDGMKFPDMVHALKPNPKNHIQEGWRIADFFSHIPEAMNMVRSTALQHAQIFCASISRQARKAACVS